ncbi:hypothetical protein [Peribacillus acanthi]|uniref:hypothetical protein n=1 Tax=Peribacillus acanthi TaxID=2171554 RepID=UPI000D3E18A9|nr:hypothetical protein [Peribacillus acanthi]
MTNRYMELILKYQETLKRDLTLEEIQLIKWIVAKEFNVDGLLMPRPSSTSLDMPEMATS